MKLRSTLLAALLMVACGDGDDEKDKDLNGEQRIIEPGSLYKGPVGGVDRYTFTDGSAFDYVVSGQMVVELSQGVVLNAEFPANVTFTVRSTNGETFTGRAQFASIPVDATARFRGETTVTGGKAVISGAFVSVTDVTIFDVQGFSYPQPLSAGVTKHEIVLQGSRLTEQKLTPAP